MQCAAVTTFCCKRKLDALSHGTRFLFLSFCGPGNKLGVWLKSPCVAVMPIADRYLGGACIRRSLHMMQGMTSDLVPTWIALQSARTRLVPCEYVWSGQAKSWSNTKASAFLHLVTAATYT